MACKTENGVSLQKLPDNKSQILGKRCILLLEIEKREIKTLKAFQKLLD